MEAAERPLVCGAGGQTMSTQPNPTPASAASACSAVIVVTGMTRDLDGALRGARKWLLRIHERKDDLPPSLLDHCDPKPLADEIGRLLSPNSVMTEHERLKELCAVVEPFAAHYACNNRASDKMADEVYQACVEMRRIIYFAKRSTAEHQMSNKSIITEETSLCNSCTRANNSCPIWEPGFYTTHCVEYRQSPSQ